MADKEDGKATATAAVADVPPTDTHTATPAAGEVKPTAAAAKPKQLARGPAHMRTTSAGSAGLGPADMARLNSSVQRVFNQTVDLGQLPNLPSRGRVIAPPRSTVELQQVQSIRRLSTVQQEVGDVDEHALSVKELASRYGVSIDAENPEGSQGLTAIEAAARVAKEGLNCLTPPKSENPFLQYLKLLR
jgi:Cation transporter/ATPase, N-terminus